MQVVVVAIARQSRRPNRERRDRREAKGKNGQRTCCEHGEKRRKSKKFGTTNGGVADSAFGRSELSKQQRINNNTLVRVGYSPSKVV